MVSAGKPRNQPLDDFEASSVRLFTALAAGDFAFVKAACMGANPALSAVPDSRNGHDGARPGSDSSATSPTPRERRRSPGESTEPIVQELFNSGDLDGFVPFDRRRRN